MLQGVTGLAEAALPTGIDVVFIAPDDIVPSCGPAAQRTIPFTSGQPIPRVGECVILAFAAEPVRWRVQDVAHIFTDEGHGIAIKLESPAD